MGTYEKAVGLLTQGRVEPLKDSAATFQVEGEHGTYITVVAANFQMCSCPATTRCSHIEACVARVRATDNELALMDAAVARRRAERRRAADELFDQLGAPAEPDPVDDGDLERDEQHIERIAGER